MSSDANCARALDAAMTALWQCTERYIQHTDVKEGDQEMARMQHIMQSYCMVDIRSKLSVESFAEARKVDAGDRTFRQVYDEIMAEKEKSLPDAKTHPKYKLYKKKVAMLTNKVPEGQGREAEGDGEDEELVITQAEVNMIDPITKQVMTSPVKNKKCGHSYDGHSIASLFRNKKVQKCPYVGCTNQGHFTMEDLEEDFELKQIIKRKLESQAL